MIRITSIIIPHRDDCTKSKKARKIGCSNVEVVTCSIQLNDESELNLFRQGLELHRDITNITFNYTDAHYYVNKDCIFIGN